MKRTLALSLLLALSPLTRAQDTAGIEYRDFTGPGGAPISAVVVDKNDTQVILLLKTGKRTTVPLDKLSDKDREYISSWNKEKAVFLQKCKNLSIRQLLELRGYESFVFRFESNSIYIDGKLNGTPGKFLIDTGAGTSLLHIPFAKTANCEVGPMDEKIYGVAGDAPAGWTDVPTISFGESVFKGRKILATDLGNGLPEGAKVNKDAILGADIMSQLDAVISYPERRIFLRPDKSDEAAVEGVGNAQEGDENVTFRIFKTKDNQTYRGKVTSKTPTVATLTLVGGKTVQVPVSKLVPADAEFVSNWTEAGAFFLQHCQSLTVQELLELRKYQSFEYERRGNHIFVDGTLNDNAVTYMIDTGADGTCLHLAAAEKNGCDVGPLDQWVYGIGGKAPAAVTTIHKLTMGDAVLTNRKILATDLNRGRDDEMDHVGLFGADFMRELEAVITYRENRIFLIQRAMPVAPVDPKKR
ncbi:retroviral-like aspartic protease family protein [Luteolibacter flavescens]|uniref:Retroviral-like aspartic protease family protein n=1 Tax=Luteolibacter flavescens TaxID=1859460 RepID=A0ABT3FUE5_9BACT|nr:retropepsin-like aspartic protease [Luteolibacter flavescens]MCW1887198.1 retroviral-like aspartic protease family protein [Luteolibacter flavescens]